MTKLSKVIEEISAKLLSLSGDKSLYIKFLTENEYITINSKQQFWSASVIKIVIACYFYNQLEKNKFDKELWVLINESNRVQGSGIVHLLDKQTRYKLEDLATLMLTLSDNAATNELIDLLGWENIENYILTELKLTNTTFKHKLMIAAGRGPNLTTAEDIGILLEKLFKNELPYSAKILDIMNEAKDRDRIPLLIPNDIRIPHKYGSLPEGMHDAGIVYAQKPFIFVFLSDDQTDKRKTNEILSACAKLCFDYANR